MFEFCCRRLQLLVPSCSTISLGSSLTHYQKVCSFSTTLSLGSERHDDRKRRDGKDQSFIVSYFINTFGFSPDLALSLTQKGRLRFRSSEQPDLVIKLLKHYGFSDTHVSEIVKKYPSVLLIKPQMTLVPKLEFLSSIGVKGTDLADFVSRNPTLLKRSLENYLRPCYDIIKALPIPDRMVLVLSRLYQGLTVSPSLLSNIAPNIAFLKAVQVPESSVNLSQRYILYTVSRETHKLKENVQRVIGMGIGPSSPTFMKALYVIFLVHELKWVQRMEFYKTTYGWTEDEFFLAFRKYPLFMALSEKKVASKMMFLVKRMGWQPAFVAGCPQVLTFSLETRIIPRYSVIRELLLKGLIMEESFTCAAVLSTKKSSFLNKFVIKYQKQVPELLDIFHGKLNLADVGLGSEETGRAIKL